MSEKGELRADIDQARKDLIALAKRMRALDERVRDVTNLQAGLKAAITLSLDYLDAIEARLLREP